MSDYSATAVWHASPLSRATNWHQKRGNSIGHITSQDYQGICLNDNSKSFSPFCDWLCPFFSDCVHIFSIVPTFVQFGPLLSNCVHLCPIVSTFVQFRSTNLYEIVSTCICSRWWWRKGLRGDPITSALIPPQSPMSITPKLMMQSQKGFPALFHQNHCVDKLFWIFLFHYFDQYNSNPMILSLFKSLNILTTKLHKLWQNLWHWHN